MHAAFGTPTAPETPKKKNPKRDSGSFLQLSRSPQDSCDLPQCGDHARKNSYSKCHRQHDADHPHPCFTLHVRSFLCVLALFKNLSSLSPLLQSARRYTGREKCRMPYGGCLWSAGGERNLSRFALLCPMVLGTGWPATEMFAVRIFHKSRGYKKHGWIF